MLFPFYPCIQRGLFAVINNASLQNRIQRIWRHKVRRSSFGLSQINPMLNKFLHRVFHTHHQLDIVDIRLLGKRLTQIIPAAIANIRRHVDLIHARFDRLDDVLVSRARTTMQRERRVADSFTDFPNSFKVDVRYISLFVITMRRSDRYRKAVHLRILHKIGCIFRLQPLSYGGCSPPSGAWIRQT